MTHDAAFSTLAPDDALFNHELGNDHELALRAALDGIDHWNVDIDALLAEADRTPNGLEGHSLEHEVNTNSEENGVVAEEDSGEPSHSGEVCEASSSPPCVARVGRRHEQSMTMALDPRKNSKKGTVMRRKEEIHELRAMVEELTKELAKLRLQHPEAYTQIGSIAATTTSTPSALKLIWQAIARRQYTARREAEQEHVRLRDLLNDSVPLTLEYLQRRHLSGDVSAVGPERLRLPPLGLAKITRRITARGFAMSHSAPSTPMRWSASLEREQLHHIELLTSQLETVLESATHQSRALLGGSSGDGKAQVLELSRDERGAAVVSLYATWLMPFAVGPVANEIWNHPVRSLCILREVAYTCTRSRSQDTTTGTGPTIAVAVSFNDLPDVTPEHTTIFSESVKTLEKTNQSADTFRGKVVSRRLQRGADTVVVTSVSGRPSMFRQGIPHARTMLRGEDWQRVRPMTASPSPTLSRVEWCRHVVVNPVMSASVPETNGIREAMHAFTEEMVNNLVDDMEFTHELMESALLRGETR